jgi:hypothetical protein
MRYTPKRRFLFLENHSVYFNGYWGNIQAVVRLRCAKAHPMICLGRTLVRRMAVTHHGFELFIAIKKLYMNAWVRIHCKKN